MTPARMATALLLGLALISPRLSAQDEAWGPPPEKIPFVDKFRQLEEILPTPNEVRTASGAPARGYWQQRADHVIDVEIDDENRRLIGSERITYLNASPDALRYLWVQLENNLLAPDSDGVTSAEAPDLDSPMAFDSLRRLLARRAFDGRVNVRAVRDARGGALPHTVVGTMMRLDLPRPLASGETTVFEIDWDYLINRSDQVGSRTGAEFFEKDGNYIYELAHWFPRMAAYTDVHGWQHKQFLGRGEFTLEFGDYEVRITVPADHVVAATGELQNAEDVLDPRRLERLRRARDADEPLFVVTPEEAKQAEAGRSKEKRTWVFRAENVRDFAFATSRKFAWDACGHRVGDRRVLCMSFFPNEGEPLWSRYSTQAIMHTLDVYSRHTFEYPYPVAISVNGPVGGMEYPMICFNGPRPEPDGTYSERTKYGLISVIIHEVGHNYFPMIVNSDERRWTWMDEGLNTFLQFLAEQEWEPGYPSRRGEPRKIVPYMRSAAQAPIMTHSDSILQFGANAYAKPATALNILRETILGRELFDFAFKEYARRWQFMRPMPSDFFRTMEDASGVDLDWFWRGWFYTTDHVDIALADLRVYRVDTLDPDVEKPLAKTRRDGRPRSMSERRNEGLERRSDRHPALLDFYNLYDELDVTPKDRETFRRTLATLDDEERALLDTELVFTILDFENRGGLVMPIILEIVLDDGSRREVRIPAEIWRRDPERVSKLLVTERPIVSVTLDPHLETADVDLSNNHWPPRPKTSRFKLFKSARGKNPMQEARDAEASDEAEGGR